MALQATKAGGFWFPEAAGMIIPTVGNGTFIIDATGEQAALILRCPKAGTLDRFDFNIGAVGNSPDNGLRASFQGVSATTGLPSGTILGATNNAFVTYAHTVTTGWKSTNFGETVTVTRGQVIACVIDIPSFTASDSVSITGLEFWVNCGLPYGVSATSTKRSDRLPIIGLHYTDGYVPLGPSFPAILAATSVTYKVDTATADEWGLAFQVPFPCKLNQATALLGVQAGADFEVLLYDGNGTTVLDTVTHDGDVTQGVGTIAYHFTLAADVTLVANTVYRVTIRPTTTNTVTFAYFTFNSADLMSTMPGGDNCYMTSQINQGGTWTDYNSGTFRRPRMSLHFTAFDDAVSAGGMVRHPGMAGTING